MRSRASPWGGSVQVLGADGGVEIRQEPGKTTVRITRTDEQGNRVTDEYEGASLEEIKREHPEVRDRLRGFDFSLGQGARPRLRGFRLVTRAPRSPRSRRSRR